MTVSRLSCCDLQLKRGLLKRILNKYYQFCKRYFLIYISPTTSQYVTAGANPMSIKKGIDKTCAHLVAKLKEHAKPVKGRTDIKVFLIEQEHRMGKHRIEIFTI